MPVISHFYGIVIYLYAMDNRKHHAPHIHVEYAGEICVINIETGEVLDGSIPPKKLKMVQVWMDIHREDLVADWHVAIKGGSIFTIDPLR